MQRSDGNGVNQPFRPADSSEGHVRLINRDSGKAVEVQNASTADGAKVVPFTDRGGANQQWQLIRVTGVLGQVHIAGRVKNAGDTVRYSWPGVYFEGRVTGTSLGIVLNDSTALNPDEPWTPDSLAAAYRSAYGDFIQKLRTRYGADTTIVAVGTGQYAGHVQQVVRTRNYVGDSRGRYWFLDDSGLDFLGCDWHYSARDDRVVSDRLTSFIAGLPTGW
ncbi:RICIN domain-containing protein [Streptomyces phaeochromogenes]